LTDAEILIGGMVFVNQVLKQHSPDNRHFTC
jgi:hypothetical protein